MNDDNKLSSFNKTIKEINISYIILKNYYLKYLFLNFEIINISINKEKLIKTILKLY